MQACGKASEARSCDVAIVGEGDDGSIETLADITTLGVNVAIVDIKLKVGNGIDVCRAIKKENPKTGVILLSAFWDDALVRAALDARADGYLLKDAEHFDLAKSIATVARGESFFDPAISSAIVRHARDDRGQGVDAGVRAEDAEILRLVAQGMTNKAIGAEMYLSQHTVRDKLSALMADLGAKNRAEAVQIATKRGII